MNTSSMHCLHLYSSDLFDDAVWAPIDVDITCIRYWLLYACCLRSEESFTALWHDSILADVASLYSLIQLLRHVGDQPSIERDNRNTKRQQCEADSIVHNGDRKN